MDCEFECMKTHYGPADIEMCFLNVPPDIQSWFKIVPKLK